MKTLLIGLFGFGLLFGGGFVAWRALDRATVARTDESTIGTNRIIAACQEAVKERLKAPATAVFSPSNEELLQDPVFDQKDNRWIYLGNVDSENGFGALPRSEYACQITDDLASVAITLDE